MNELTSALESLQLAEGSLSTAQASYDTATLDYTSKIAMLENQIAEIKREMKEDLDAQSLFVAAGVAKNNLLEATVTAKLSAERVWRNGFTYGKKTWSQSGYTMRIREARTPVVTRWRDALFSIDVLSADNIINTVVIKLNKKMTVTLHDTISGGIDGIEIQEKITCTVKPVKK